MARKQETPAPLVEAKDPAAATETSAGQAEGGGSPLSPDTASTPELGEASVPASAPGPDEGASRVAPEGQAATGSGAEVIKDGNGAFTDVSATGPGAPEGASQVASDLTDDADPLVEGDHATATLNPATLQIYPLRSYMDEGELRRRGGPAYTVARRHAEELVQRKLASLEPLKE